MFSALLMGTDENGKPVEKEYSGYVPDFMPGEHYGDYVELTIELDTGKFLNWKKPTKKQLAVFDAKKD